MRSKGWVWYSVLTIIFVMACVLVNGGRLFAEEVTITTYYPAPYGVYEELRTKKLGIGESWYDATQFPITGNTDLIVEGQVGIGTLVPETNTALHVKRVSNVGWAGYFEGPIGIYATGWGGGGYFKDTDSDSWCWVGSGAYGVYGKGSNAGGQLLSLGDDPATITLAMKMPDGRKVSVLGNGDILTSGDILSKGKKPFVIDHPLKQGMKLLHAAIEGPEAGVYYRGEDRLVDGRAEIYLPEYFEALVRKEERTVLLTPIFEAEEKVSQLATSRVIDGKFIVRAIDTNNLNQRFYWEVKAVRGDISPLEVEQAAERFPDVDKLNE